MYIFYIQLYILIIVIPTCFKSMFTWCNEPTRRLRLPGKSKIGTQQNLHKYCKINDLGT